MKTWSVSNIESAKYLGILAFRDTNNERYDFEVLATSDRLVFGGSCNTGFLESGFMELEDGETPDKALQELLADLEVFYNDGRQYCSRIICNERM